MNDFKSGLKREQVVEINGKDRVVNIEPLRDVLKITYKISPFGMSEVDIYGI